MVGDNFDIYHYLNIDYIDYLGIRIYHKLTNSFISFRDKIYRKNNNTDILTNF